MPLYGPMPEHRGEFLLAERLLQLDDGQIHLMFDVLLPGVSNIDVLIWDEQEGVFCIEVKAVPLDMVEEISPSEVVIQGRGRGRSPMSQARKGAFELLSFLREGMSSVPWLTATAGWPNIHRLAWEAHWNVSTMPTGYAESLIFADDLVDVGTLRQRLRWIRAHAPWGSTEPKPFVHRASELSEFLSCVVARATANASQPENKTSRRQYRERISLDTDAVRDASHSLHELVSDAAESMPAGWAEDLKGRIAEISTRLDRPFKLGIVGEFRAGKSSVLNALVGEQIALVSELECTFCPHRVAHGDDVCAYLYTDGGVVRNTLEEARNALRKAEDVPDHDGIKKVETFIPAAILETVDIWDSPGFGGSDGHQTVAEEFVEQIDAAVWVFNKDYMGQRALDDVLESLRVRGKTIIGVVNKCENLSQPTFDKLRIYMSQAYPGIQFAAVIPFSASLALEPALGQNRDGMATDDSGNISLLLETLRSHIIANPNRLTARAAAGDLRAIGYAVRDDIQRGLLDERRRLFLFKSQFERGKEILSEKLHLLGVRLEEEALAKLRHHLTSDSKRALQKASVDDLCNVARIRSQIEKSISEDNIREILDRYFESQAERVSETVREAGIDVFEEYVSRLTQFERLGHAEQWQIAILSTEDEAAGKEKAAGVAVITGAALGALALAIPGPQWPFVAVGVLVSYLAARNMTKAESTMSENDLRLVREGEWAEAIARYMVGAGDDVREAIQQVLRQVHAQATEILGKQIMVAALGSQTPESRLEELARLEALRQGAELIIEELGDPTLELPHSDVLQTTPLALESGNRSQSQSLLRRILSSSREMVAIADGSLSSACFPILLEVPDEAAIRLLAWEQPTSAAGEAFRIGLSELRTKRSGTVHVVAPLATNKEVEALPQGTWVFVPGWAYRLNAPIMDAWNASTPIEIHPYEDDGALYQQHFARWFDDNVQGYQGLQV